MDSGATIDASDARAALIAAARRLDVAGLNLNASGNLSIRVGQDILVTPSGMPPEDLRPDDPVLLDIHGDVVRGRRTPTSEWRLHVGVMARRPDVQAVVHTHSPEATAASALRRPVPAVHYVVARFGGAALACTPYATYGSPELAAGVVSTLGAAGTACLMANHGAVTVAGDLDSAVALAQDVEWFCGVHRRAVQLGTPTALDPAEIARVAERFAAYGQPPPAGS